MSLLSPSQLLSSFDCTKNFALPSGLPSWAPPPDVNQSMATLGWVRDYGVLSRKRNGEPAAVPSRASTVQASDESNGTEE